MRAMLRSIRFRRPGQKPPGDTKPWPPDIVVKPTLAQVLAGDDPVLAAALSYRP